MQSVSSEPKTTLPSRILVVDDNHDAAESLMMLLRVFKYEARMALDARSALEIVPQFKPHVLLIDIGLPDMDGYTLAAKIRLLDDGKNTVLIALSGHQEDQARSKAAGFTYHLVKPVDLEQLKTKLAEVRS